MVVMMGGLLSPAVLAVRVLFAALGRLKPVVVVVVVGRRRDEDAPAPVARPKRVDTFRGGATSCSSGTDTFAASPLPRHVTIDACLLIDSSIHRFIHTYIHSFIHSFIHHSFR